MIILHRKCANCRRKIRRIYLKLALSEEKCKWKQFGAILKHHTISFLCTHLIVSVTFSINLHARYLVGQARKFRKLVYVIICRLTGKLDADPYTKFSLILPILSCLYESQIWFAGRKADYSRSLFRGVNDKTSLFSQ